MGSPRPVHGPIQASESTRQLLSEEVDLIKVGISTGSGDKAWGDNPTLTTEEIRAICKTAHAEGIPVAAHAIGCEAVRRAISGGVDTIEHGYDLDVATCKLVAASSAWLIPTLRTRYVRTTPEAQATSRKQFQTLQTGIEAGIRYAAGTDSVGDQFTPHGTGNALEIELLGKALTPDAAILAGTRDAARATGRENDVGTIEPRKYADLIAVPKDPRLDLSVLQRVEFVMQGGRVVRSPGINRQGHRQ